MIHTDTKKFNINILHSLGFISTLIDIKNECDFASRLLDLTKHLGKPIVSRKNGNAYDILKPMEAKQANYPSLSKLFSFGKFPLHTDGAHWAKPPRFIALACFNPGEANRATLILDTKSLSLTQEQKDLLNSIPLRIRNGRNSFFDSIYSKNRKFIRYDIGCMEPVCNKGDSALNVLSGQNWSQQIKKIQWHSGKVIIFDNWRYLHGRDIAACEDKNRKLLRILIE